MQEPQEGVVGCTLQHSMDVSSSVCGSQYAAGVGTVDFNVVNSAQLHVVPLVGSGVYYDQSVALEEVEMARMGRRTPSLSLSSTPEEEDLLDDDEHNRDDGLSPLSAIERDFIHVMRSERITELLESKSSKFIHKFSIVFPAHVVATVLCVWFLIVFLIVGLMSTNHAEKIKSMGDRIEMLEGIVGNSTRLT